MLSLIQRAGTAVDSVALRILREKELDWSNVVDLRDLAAAAIRVVAILVLAWLSYRVLMLLLQRIERTVEKADPTTVSAHEQRVRTLVGLVRSFGVVFIAVIAIFMVLDAFGLRIGPLLAGAGVVGLAISFGAQSLVKDCISGLFILVEDQFGVGDVIRIGELSGRVERLTLRIVVMRDSQGVVHIVPNGEIKHVSNLTRAFSRAVLDVSVPYSEDADRVIEVMRDVGRGLWADPAWHPLFTEEIIVPGIESLDESSLKIRIVATTVPLKQWDVARELRRRLKRRFDQEGIEFPATHVTVLQVEEPAGRNDRPPAASSPPATGSGA